MLLPIQIASLAARFNQALIIYMKKFLNADWLRAAHFFEIRCQTEMKYSSKKELQCKFIFNFKFLNFLNF